MTDPFNPDLLESAAIREDELANEIAGLNRDATKAMLDGDFDLNTVIMKMLAILEAERDVARYTVASEKAKFRLQEALADIEELPLV